MPDPMTMMLAQQAAQEGKQRADAAQRTAFNAMNRAKYLDSGDFMNIGYIIGFVILLMLAVYGFWYMNQDGRRSRFSVPPSTSRGYVMHRLGVTPWRNLGYIPNGGRFITKTNRVYYGNPHTLSGGVIPSVIP